MAAESFRARLRRLRRESEPLAESHTAAEPHTTTDAASAPPLPDIAPVDPRERVARSEAVAHAARPLAEQLARHAGRRARHAARAEPRTEPDTPPIAALSAARPRNVAFGPPAELERADERGVLARRRVYAREHAHGAYTLGEALHADSAALELCARDAALSDTSLADALYLDTETTGLSGGAGTYVFLVGLGRFTADGFEVWQGFLADPAHERALLAETAERIARAPLLVTFFGKAFDRHRLEDKMRMHGVTPPFVGKPHLDLYHPLRRLYAASLPDARLRTMEHALCGVERADDLPGSFAPAAWFDFLAGRGHLLEGVFAHNADDVLSLVTLAAHVSRVLDGARASGELLAGCAASRALALANLHAERREHARALATLVPVLAELAPDVPQRRALALRVVEFEIALGELTRARTGLETLLTHAEDVAAATALALLLRAELRARVAHTFERDLATLARIAERRAIGRDHARLVAALATLRARGERLAGRDTR